MIDPLRTELDRQWEAFLTQLNGAYESAYTKLLATVPQQGTLVAAHLASMQWPVNGNAEIEIVAVIRKHKRRDNG